MNKGLPPDAPILQRQKEKYDQFSTLQKPIDENYKSDSVVQRLDPFNPFAGFFFSD